MKNQTIVVKKTTGWDKFPSTLIHSAFARAFGLAMILAITMLASLPEVGLGQCPDSMTPDPGPAWTSETPIHVQLPGTNCWVTITYCDRNNGVPSDWETYITSVTPDPGDTCEDPQVLFEGAQNYFDAYGDPTDISIPPCGGDGQTVVTYLMRCWKAEYITPGYPTIPTYFACPSDISCKTTCTECYDSETGKDVITGCNKVAGTYNHDCTTPTSWPWPADVCYDGGNMCGPN